MVNTYQRHEWMELIFLVVYVTLAIGIFVLFFGLGPSAGFSKDVILQKAMFYIGFGSIFLFGIIALKLAGIFVFGKKHADVEGVVVHDPEQGLFPNLRLFKNPWLLTFFSIIFFGILGWLASRYQTFFSAIPDYEQQFTKGADLFFSVFPASIVETLGAIFLISLLGFILGYMTLKNKLSKGWFLTMFVIGGPLISMTYGIINHISRYGGQDIAMSSVAVFWFVGGLITVLTGSMIPFIIMHDANNFYFKFSTLFGSDIVTFTTFSILGLMLILFLIILFRGKKKKNA